MKDSTVIYTLSLLALCMMATIAYMGRAQFLEGHNDFSALYNGPLLLATGELYDNAALQAKEEELTGLWHPTSGYIRPPFVAVLMWPLSQLPYFGALRLWQAASLSALAGFALLWKPTPRHLTVLSVCLSIPALLAWSNGQDTPFLLLLIVWTTRLHLGGRPLHAGMVFALCAAKAHLFLLTPIWILARRDWGFLRGLLLGGAALAVVSTLAAGWSWPVEMWREVQNPAFSPNPQLMTNLHAAFVDMSWGWVAEATLSATVVAAAWIMAKHAGFLSSLGGLLIGGILLARHTYTADLLIALPACLTVITLGRSAILRGLAVALLLPPAALAINFGAAYSLTYTLALWALLIGWAVESRQTSPVEIGEATA